MGSTPSKNLLKLKKNLLASLNNNPVEDYFFYHFYVIVIGFDSFDITQQTKEAK